MQNSPLLPVLHRDRAGQRPREASLPFDLTAAPDLPVPRASYRQLLEVTSHPRSSSQDLVDVLALDPALAARILRLANRPREGQAEPITSLPRAVLRLGPRLVGQVALGVQVWQSLNDGPDAAVTHLWRHSAQVALMARRLARLLGVDTELSFSGGLLHDIGRIALLSRHPGDESARAGARTPGTLEREREHYGADHAEIGRSLASRWGLPTTLVGLIGDHHRAIGPGEPPGPLAAIRLAELLLSQVERECSDGSAFDLEFAATIDVLTRQGRSPLHLRTLVQNAETESFDLEGLLARDR